MTLSALVYASDNLTIENAAHAQIDGTDQYSDDESVATAFTGIITITKTNEEGNAIKSGATAFSVYKDSDTENPLSFIKVDEGVYALAENGEIEATYPQTYTELNTNSDGTVTIQCVGAGSYWFEEKKAPDGYSINDKGVTVEITKQEAEEATANIEKNAKLKDTKLPFLPTTGGIGTTIFTIAGIILMITAAGIYFTRRKKVSGTANKA